MGRSESLRGELAKDKYEGCKSKYMESYSFDGCFVVSGMEEFCCASCWCRLGDIKEVGCVMTSGRTETTSN